MPEVQNSPQAEMSGWLMGERDVPSAFEIDEECELRDQYGEGAVIKIKGSYNFV